jgi:hypothetical protein
MSASEQQRADWLDPGFWERLDRLQGKHQRLQAQHHDAQRGLERLTPREAEELRRAWAHYCQVIDELDRSSAEFEALRMCAD